MDTRPGGRTEAWARARTPVTLIARLLLGLVFAFSAISKITAPGAFRDSVTAYHLLPHGLVIPFATALPWIEALVALYLLVGLFLRPTAVVTAALLVMFTGALAISLARGNTGHGCGCFTGSGPIGSLAPVQWLAGGATITWFDVVRDLVFILLAVAIYWGDRYAFSLDGLLFRPPAPGDDEPDYDDDRIVAPVAPAPIKVGTRGGRARATAPARGLQGAPRGRK